jgi:ABC-2 type transport system ATP-binding protein
MTQTILEISNLRKVFGTRVAVEDVSLTIAPGTVYSLIGPNGSGKTTIIRSIAGLLRPSAGSIKVAGIDLATDPVGAKAQLGYIPDDPSVWTGMTGEEFLDFVGALFGVSTKKRAQRIPELLELFSLQGIETERFDGYSRGNRQKFAILAALLHRPKLLLVDEPLVGLDPTSAHIALSTFRSYADEGNAVLLVTHTLSAAEELTDQIGFIKHGRLTASGTLPELRSAAGLAGDASIDAVYDALAQ